MALRHLQNVLYQLKQRAEAYSDDERKQDAEEIWRVLQGIDNPDSIYYELG